MASGSRRNPTAFVSYAQSERGWKEGREQAWRNEVRGFVEVLRAYGIDADVDLFHLHERGVDWTRFGAQSIVDREWVLAAVSPAWRERYEGGNKPTQGAGAVAEADALRSLFQENQGKFRDKLVLVYLPSMRDESVPIGLHGMQRFRLRDFSLASLRDLLALLTCQPLVATPPLGNVPELASEPLTTPPAVTERPQPVDGAAAPVDADELVREVEERVDALRAALARTEPPMPSDGPHLPHFGTSRLLRTHLREAEIERAELLSRPDDAAHATARLEPGYESRDRGNAGRSPTVPVATDREMLDLAVAPPGAPGHRSVYAGVLLLRIVARPVPHDASGPTASAARDLLVRASQVVQRHAASRWRPTAGGLLLRELVDGWRQEAPRVWHAGDTTGDAERLVQRPTAAVALQMRPLVLTVDRTHATRIARPGGDAFYAAHDPEIAADTSMVCLLAGAVLCAAEGVVAADVLVQIAAGPSGRTLVGADAYNPPGLAFGEPTNRITPTPPFAPTHYLNVVRAEPDELLAQPEHVAERLLDDWLSMFRSRDVFEDLLPQSS